jgi:hypothetical protein
MNVHAESIVKVLKNKSLKNWIDKKIRKITPSHTIGVHKPTINVN